MVGWLVCIGVMLVVGVVLGIVHDEQKRRRREKSRGRDAWLLLAVLAAWLALAIAGGCSAPQRQPRPPCQLCKTSGRVLWKVRYFHDGKRLVPRRSYRRCPRCQRPVYFFCGHGTRSVPATSGFRPPASAL